MIIRKSAEQIEETRCTSCDCLKPSDRYKQCASCREYYRENHKKLYKQKRLKGICIFGPEKAEPGKALCAKHQAKVTLRMKAFYQQRRVDNEI